MSTPDQIQAKANRASVPFTLAKHIREILDEAKRTYGAVAWEEDGLDTQISELVFEDE